MELLKAENLTKRFLKKTVLEDVNITLDKGKIYGLVGPNGSGKTTFMKIAAGLLQPTAGSIEIDGRRIGTRTKSIVSFVPTTNPLPQWMRVKNCLSYYRDFFPDFDPVRADELLDFMDLKTDRKISSLSTGLAGRLKLALALSRRAKLYILDEPLNGLDPISRDKVLEAVVQALGEDNSLLISSHLIRDMETVLDEVIFLDNGKVVLSGNAEELRMERGFHQSLADGCCFRTGYSCNIICSYRLPAGSKSQYISCRLPV